LVPVGLQLGEKGAAQQQTQQEQEGDLVIERHGTLDSGELSRQKAARLTEAAAMI
jgi:hypothetical protein